MKKILLMIPCMVLALLVLFPVKAMAADTVEYNGKKYIFACKYTHHYGYNNDRSGKEVKIYTDNPDATILVIVYRLKNSNDTYSEYTAIVSLGGDSNVYVCGDFLTGVNFIPELNIEALNENLHTFLPAGGKIDTEVGVWPVLLTTGNYIPSNGDVEPWVDGVTGCFKYIPYDPYVGNPTYEVISYAVGHIDEMIHRAEADDPGFKLIDFLTTIEYFDGENWYYDGEGESGGGHSRGDSETDGGASRGGPCVNVFSTWTGTTYDYRTDLDLSDAYILINAGYVAADTEESSDSSVTVEYLDSDTLISAKSLDRTGIDFFSSDGTLRLRYLEFTPVYQTSRVICYGTPRYVYFTDVGSIDESELHGDYIQDYSLKLTDVHLSDDMLGAKKSISWTGTSKDDVISSVPTDRKLVAVVVEAKNSDGEYCYYAGKNFVQILNQGSYEAPVFSHLTVDMFTTTDKTEHLPRYVPLNSYQLIVYWELVDAVYSAKDLELTGRLFLFPAYFSKNRGDIVSGAVTCVDIVNEKIEQVDEDEDGNPVTNPIDDDDSVPLPDLDLDDMDLSSFWDVIQNIVNSMGRVPYIFAAIFPFLPDWVCYLISFSIVALVLLRFLGR